MSYIDSMCYKPGMLVVALFHPSLAGTRASYADLPADLLRGEVTVLLRHLQHTVDLLVVALLLALRHGAACPTQLPGCPGAGGVPQVIAPWLAPVPGGAGGLQVRPAHLLYLVVQVVSRYVLHTSWPA